MDSSSEVCVADEDLSASEGLEEGEVEGETLLIVEAEDQASLDLSHDHSGQGSVDLSHDQSGDSLTSDVGEETDGWAAEEMSFYCQRCHKWIPAAQLHGEQPSYLKGDNFFKFVCCECSEDGKESFERMRLTWQQVVMLAMYNLSLEGTGRQGYFRWKEDICAFIGRHWNFLLGTRKKTSTWWSTVAGCLSVGSPTFFRSGAQEFGEPGWWKLVQNKPPTLRPDMDKTTAKTKVSKPPVEPIITVEGLRKRGARNPVENAIQLKEKRSRTHEAKDIRRAQKEAVSGYTQDRSASSTPVKQNIARGAGSAHTHSHTDPRTHTHTDPRTHTHTDTRTHTHTDTRTHTHTDTRTHTHTDTRTHTHNDPRTHTHADTRTHTRRAELEKGEVIDFSSLSSSERTPLTSPSPSPSPDPSGGGTPASHSATPSLLSEQDLIPDAMPPQALFHDDEEMETEGVIDPGMECFPAPSASVSRKKLRAAAAHHIKREAESEGEEGRERERETLGVCVSAVERRRITHTEKQDLGPPQTPRFAMLSLYEERMLLRRLAACPLALAVTPQAKRLHRKLLVRQAQRQRGRPLLDLDRAVGNTLSLVGGLYTPPAGLSKHCTSSKDSRVLDRFQTTVCSRRLQMSSVSFWNRLMGAQGSMEQSIKSPYTARVLKPFIRRDYESRPLKLRLLAEIRAVHRKKDPDWLPEVDAPIDYCYVRPNHIPSVNAMCHDSFWPGVDLSECLQYPDFSVVALYKKVVVGFGFMVPDVKYNEAYISFLLVHPEWRQAGIGTFMTYHLIQTCMGKDVTLHVSASNPAMLLYQKFGFKAEEYILDFYDKYYPVDSTQCRHAFFLRLRR